VPRFVELGHVLEWNPPVLDVRGHAATCLHAPFHRFEDGDDLSRIPLGAVAGIPGIVVDAFAQSGALKLELDKETVRDRAVIIRTGWDERWRTARYWEPGPYLEAEMLDLLVRGGAVLLGVDFWNVDDSTDGASQARTRLLRAGILVVEHLCNLRGLPREGFRFFAVPLRIAGGSSFPVRAFAELASGNARFSPASHGASAT
jgi:kynurenine formamidase